MKDGEDTSERARWLKLYWCSTDDHQEDWFVVARCATDAVRLFADHEGYDDDEVSAEAVLVLPEALEDEKHHGWPSHELLLSCGAKFLRTETPRVVELDGVRYAEGMLEHQILQLDDDLFEEREQGRPNQTRRRSTS